MPNPIKYSSTSQFLALKTGNYYIGTGDVGKGPTSSTGYYNGITPPSGGYTIYLNKASGGPSIFTPTNDAELILITNKIAGTNYTTVIQCLNYFAGQNDKMCFNRDYEGIVTDGLVLNLDAGFIPSYPTNGNTWYDIGLDGRNGTLTNGPTFDSGNGGSIVFDGTNDYVALSDFGLTTSGFSCVCVFKFNVAANGNTLFNLNYVYPNSGYLIRQMSQKIVVFTDNGTETYIQSTSTIDNNTIYHLAVTQDSGTCTIYLNGIQDKQSSLANPVLNSSAETSLARRGAPSIGAYLNGNIYNATIYNKVLSSTEITQNYNALKSRYGL